MNRHLIFCMAVACCTGTICGCTLESVLSCVPGEHPNNNRSECIPDSAEACGNESTNCYDLPGVDKNALQCILHDSRSICEISKCNDGFALLNGAFDQDGKASDAGTVRNYCIPEDASHCGANDIDCVSLKPENAKSVVCDTDAHLCRIEQCTSAQFKLVDSTSSVGWMNQCTDVSDMECRNKYCTGDAFEHADKVDCDTTRTNNECIISSCRTGYYLYGDTCQPDSDEHCGNYDISCIATDDNPYPALVQSMRCEDGKCKISSCTNDGELKNGVCEKRSFECDNEHPCIKDEGVKSVSCVQNVCQIGECDLDTHHPRLTDNGIQVCVPHSVTDCSTNTTPHNCNDIPGFDKALDGKCEKGQCSASECQTGYHIKEGSMDGIAYKTCVENDVTKCGDKEDNCNETIWHSVTTTCENGYCQAKTCDTGMHPDPNKDKTVCVNDTSLACGQDAIDCMSENVASATCNNGRCQKTCKQSTHLTKDSSACIPDTDTECGSNRKDCTTIERAVSARCEKGECRVETCESGSGPIQRVPHALRIRQRCAGES